MKNRSSHAGKSNISKKRYIQNTLKAVGGPTLENEIDFGESSKGGANEDDEKRPATRRKINPWNSFVNSIKNFFNKNLGSIVIAIATGLAGIMLSYFIDTQVMLGSIQNDIKFQQQQLDQLLIVVDKNDLETQEKIKAIQESINLMSEKINNKNDKDNEQDTLLNEIKLRIEFLKDQVDKKEN